MRIPTLYVMIGVSGSGKSTFAKWLSANEHGCVVSTDEIRGLLYGDPAVQGNGRRVFDAAYLAIQCNLRLLRDTVFDATNTTKKGRDALFDAVQDVPCVKTAVLCTPKLQTCLDRNRSRDRIVPDFVIHRQHDQLLQDGESILEQFDCIMFTKQEETL